MGQTGMSSCQDFYAYRTKCHESTGESLFYLLYGQDARIPIEETLSFESSNTVDVDDYKLELASSLGELLVNTSRRVRTGRSSSMTKGLRQNLWDQEIVLWYTCPRKPLVHKGRWLAPILVRTVWLKFIWMASLSDKSTDPKTHPYASIRIEYPSALWSFLIRVH